MDKESIVGRFYIAIEEDPRIRGSHICVFITLIFLFAEDETYPCIFLNGELIERYSKLEKKTCLKCIRELALYGYLKYQPTNDSRYKSKIIIEHQNE